MDILLLSRLSKTSKPSDLFRAFDEISGQLEQSNLPENTSFEDVGAKWTQEAGVPVVTVTRNYALRNVRVTQERFYNHPKERKSDTRWWIPLTWMTASSQDSHLEWMYEDKTFAVDAGADDWILFNRNSTGN